MARNLIKLAFFTKIHINPIFFSKLDDEGDESKKPTHVHTAGFKLLQTELN